MNPLETTSRSSHMLPGSHCKTTNNVWYILLCDMVAEPGAQTAKVSGNLLDSRRARGGALVGA